MRIRRSSADIRVLAIPNDNSVGCHHGTERQFGWRECHGAEPDETIQWLAVHGVIRGISKVFARQGDLEVRLVADPAVRADPVAFIEELRAIGPIVRCRALYMIVDDKIVNDLLRSEDFHVFAMGSNLPKPLQWFLTRTRP